LTAPSVSDAVASGSPSPSTICQGVRPAILIGHGECRDGRGSSERSTPNLIEARAQLAREGRNPYVNRTTSRRFVLTAPPNFGHIG